MGGDDEEDMFDEGSQNPRGEGGGNCLHCGMTLVVVGEDRRLYIEPGAVAHGVSVSCATQIAVHVLGLIIRLFGGLYELQEVLLRDGGRVLPECPALWMVPSPMLPHL